MKKAIRISSVAFVLCGLLILIMLKSVGNIHAATPTPQTQPVQVQNTGYTDSKGTITVSAACPENYYVQNGSVQITGYSQTETPKYDVQANGIQGNTWTTTIENKLPGSLNITVTANC